MKSNYAPSQNMTVYVGRRGLISFLNVRKFNLIRRYAQSVYRNPNEKLLTYE